MPAYSLPPGPDVPRVLLVEDDATHALLISERVKSAGARVVLAASCGAARRALESEAFDLVLLDAGLPDGNGLEIHEWLLGRRDPRPVVFVTSDDLAEHAVRSLRSGARHYIVKRPNYLEQVAEVVTEILAEQVSASRDGASGTAALDRLVGESPAIAEVRRLVLEYADSDAPLLVTGETGTGKELVARGVHETGTRAKGPFVAVNCSAIAPTLFESELFGNVSGAYTGANRSRSGLVGAARGGILFLDEVGELLLDIQPKLLRLIEAGTYRPVGASQEQRADVRIVAATNRPLEQLVERGEFRSDLYYRLDVLRIHVPALRDRRGDIPRLVDHLLGRSRVSRGAGPATPQAVAKLMMHPWPGNVRELEHVVERTLLAGVEGPIVRFDLSRSLESSGDGADNKLDGDRLIELLTRHRGRLRPVAEATHVSIRTVQRRMKELGLRLREFRRQA